MAALPPLDAKAHPRLSFRCLDFLPVQAPAWERADRDFGGGVVEARHAGDTVRVTGKQGETQVPSGVATTSSAALRSDSLSCP